MVHKRDRIFKHYKKNVKPKNSIFVPGYGNLFVSRLRPYHIKALNKRSDADELRQLLRQRGIYVQGFTDYKPKQTAQETQQE